MYAYIYIYMYTCTVYHYTYMSSNIPLQWEIGIDLYTCVLHVNVGVSENSNPPKNKKLDSHGVA